MKPFPKDRHFLVKRKAVHYENSSLRYVHDGDKIQEAWYTPNVGFAYWCGNDFTHTTDSFREEDILAWCEIPEELK